MLRKAFMPHADEGSIQHLVDEDAYYNACFATLTLYILRRVRASSPAKAYLCCVRYPRPDILQLGRRGRRRSAPCRHPDFPDASFLGVWCGVECSWVGAAAHVLKLTRQEIRESKGLRGFLKRKM
jgi:hypothetical protein